MRKKLFALFAILTLTLTACGSDTATVFSEVNTVEGVSMTLKEGTLKSSKATFIIANDSDADVLFDPVEFHLEELDDDGVWQENTSTRVSQWKRDKTETIPAHTSIEREVDWKGLCGTIGTGQYRVILIINDSPVACEISRDL